MVSAELATFLQSGISVLVGTRDAGLAPETLRAVGARVEPGGNEATVFVPVATGARTLANLRDNGRIAVCFSRAEDHRSVQLKGGVLSLRDGDGADREAIERYLSLLAQSLSVVGVPPRIVGRFGRWPAHAVRFRIEAVFVQTPGPGAGDSLVPPERAEQRR
jgi:hypothetical protein